MTHIFDLKLQHLDLGITCTQQLVAEVVAAAEAVAASRRVLVEVAVGPIAYWVVVWYPVLYQAGPLNTSVSRYQCTHLRVG